MKRIFYMMIASLLLFACSQNDFLGDSSKNCKTTLTFSADGYDIVNTRGTTNEKKLNDVTILQFVNGTLAVKTELGETNTGSVIPIDGLQSMPASTMEEEYINGETVKRLTENGKENVIVFLANEKAVNGSVDDLKENTSTYADYKKMTYTMSDEPALTEVLPMIGYYYGGIVDGATNQMNVWLTRSVAKINFTLNTDNFKVNTETPTITINSIKLFNVPKTISPYAQINRPTLPTVDGAGIWPNVQSPFPEYSETGFYDEYPMENQSTNKSFIGFMPENVRGSYDKLVTSNKTKHPLTGGGLEYLSDKDALTYILVDLDYTLANGIIKNAKYRIYLGGDAKGDMNILRNTQYNVTTYLYGANKADTRINVESIWDPTNVILPEGYSDVEKDANCYIIDPFNIPKEHKFNISLNLPKLGWKKIDDMQSNGLTTYVDRFKELIKTDNWEIITLWRTWGNQRNDCNVIGKKIKGSTYIPGEDNNGEDNYLAELDFSNIKSEDFKENGVIQGQNALIALVNKNDYVYNGEKIEAGTVFWSWHLWFTDYNPSKEINGAMQGANEGYTSTAFQPSGAHYLKKMMDRNLGATVLKAQEITPNNDNKNKYEGLNYQFGRKDPFFNSNGIYYNSNGEICSLSKIAFINNYSTTIINPSSLLTSTSSWFANKYIFWNDGSFLKSPFDPCPYGWRIPKITAFNNSSNDFQWSTNPEGLVCKTNNKIYYPSINYITSAGTFAKYYGVYNWSSSSHISNSYAYFLKGTSGSISNQGQDRPSASLSVRPVQE